MMALGKCYAEGHGVNQNANKAFELHRAAAAAGSGSAHFLVAHVPILQSYFSLEQGLIAVFVTGTREWYWLPV
jgi:hypothetical protein